MILFTLIILAAYLIGSIPTGYWFAKLFFNTDITNHGTGNIGASNIARVFGNRWFLVVFLIDAVKAYAVMFMSSKILDYYPMLYWVAAAILIGNAYSIFLKFKGGKGVATAVGIFAYVLPTQFNVLFMLLWLMVLWLTKKPFIASLVAVMTLTLLYGVLYDGMHLTFLLFICVWLGFRHLSNLRSWLARKPI